MSLFDIRYDDTPLPEPPSSCAPERYRDRLDHLFDRWHTVRSRNAQLSTYYNMHNVTHDLGVSIPPQLVRTNVVVGWAQKAVDVMAVRSKFEGYVFGGQQDVRLDKLVRQNRLVTLYQRAVTGQLVHGISAISVMRGTGPGPKARVRSYSANQCAVLWDKDAGRIGSGIVLADVDIDGRATRYVAHFPDAVLVFEYDGNDWRCTVEPHAMGRPMLEPLVFEANDDRPLGHSRITPEVMGIIDKAMRDVLRMEVGAEFFTAPQRYILGADEHLFDAAPAADDEDDEAGSAGIDRGAMLKAYLGAFLAITRDENGDIPQVGQFAAGDAHNFISVFENDAQRFSGATNVPLGQLGVLSNTYTSSDALGAANDPLILEVERLNTANKEAMEEVARMMMAVESGVPLDQLPEQRALVQAYFSDPSMPTISARADAWTKLGAQDQGIVGTRVYYEGIGIPQATIDRIEQAKASRDYMSAVENIAAAIGAE